MLIGTGRRGAGVAAIALGGLAAGVIAGCAEHSHKTHAISKATAVVPVSNEVHGYVSKVWPDAGRIWPGVVLKDRRVIIGDGKVARLVTVEGVKNLGAADLTRHRVTIPASGSLYTSWDGHPAVVINSADPAYADEAKNEHASLSQILFGAATDELFHSWQQRGKPLDQHQLRGTEYPLAVTPRLYRAMLYDDVVAAYHDPQQKKQRLANASYWYSRWQKEYPDEAKRAAATDAAEGAAGYFDAVAAAMAEGADRKDPGDLREHVSYAPLDQGLDPRHLTVDGEAAPLGALSGLLLDENKKDENKKGKKAEQPWQRQVTQGGQTPLGLLLQGVAPAAEQPSDDLRQGIQDVLAKQNSDLIPRFNPLVRAYNDHGDKLLLVPLESATGDLDTGGYYTTKDVPYAMLARLTGTFQFPSGKLKANEASVLTGAIRGRQYVIVPLDTEHKDTRLSDGRLRLDTGPLVGTFRVKAQKMAGRDGLVAH
ncbi:hypothetical protein GCM10027176_75920 [Actinoallomurus bryophytorum]|uniref:Lipoprotein n=1 Tax=Actinoallomurus bryophytorum TaxID=1490222 RepID=A0A543CSJ7_9ACTN|nr:hypothetical protein [Actinoallomurus bryophytorum]TQM00082.1 hypothetical protein FB559_5787 [Actinoallomurus bryophytorum]